MDPVNNLSERKSENPKKHNKCHQIIYRLGHRDMLRTLLLRPRNHAFSGVIRHFKKRGAAVDFTPTTNDAKPAPIHLSERLCDYDLKGNTTSYPIFGSVD
ncbi:MAG: hypothetical protein ACI9BD_001438 [Candidatus Marinamargulisbacteria bacterium]|jgi:hypothetical protein